MGRLIVVAVVLVLGGSPKGGFSFRIKAAVAFKATIQNITVSGKPGQWTDWTHVPEAQPVMRLQFDPVPGDIEFETKETRAKASLFGPILGLVTVDGKVRTMADHNRRYWRHVVDAPSPKKIILADRFDGGSDDLIEWEEGIKNLTRAGINCLMVAPKKVLGKRTTCAAVYCPPGWAFDFAKEDLASWAKEVAKPYHELGWNVKLFALGDEPSWPYPKMFALDCLPRFHEYLRDRKFAPEDFGCKNWNEVKPCGPKGHKKLFYWTCRFFPWASCSLYRRATAEIHKAFGRDIPAYVNWNNFAGRLYTPEGGAHDWFEFARECPKALLWTEDWFGDHESWQWSYYCSKMRSTGLPFGGYVVGRMSTGGVALKTLALVGHGAKIVKFYGFGPEYNFPQNCYSENCDKVLPGIARSARIIAAAEDVLFPGKAPPAEVAILASQSSPIWDKPGILDVTNTGQNYYHAAWTAEMADLYLALMHSNIPADFVDEQGDLSKYRVLYVTAPNVPIETQKAIAEWVRKGGTLVMCADAARRDRYNDAISILTDLAGIEAPDPARPHVMPDFHIADLVDGAGIVIHKESVKVKEAEVLATFKDGAPAITRRGTVYHHAFFPGITYWAQDKSKPDGIKARGWIAAPVKITPPVTLSVPMIEAPMLVSDAGAAVTLLNWSGKDVPSVKVSVRFKATSVQSVEQGRLEFTQVGDRIEFSLPLKDVDVLRLK